MQKVSKYNKNTPPSSFKNTKEETGQSTVERIVGLDLFRISLAFIIFLFHSRGHMNCNYGFLNTFVENSNVLAMTGFFMLSGYSLIISNGKRDYRIISNVVTFYKKRFISVWPLYFVAGYLGVAMFIMLGRQTVIDNLILLPVELLCVQSFYDSLFSYSHNAGSWFISCLVACYFLFPWLNMLLIKIRRKQLILLLLLLVVLLAYFPYVSERFNTSSIYANPFFRLLEFTAGMTIAVINTNMGSDNSLFLKTMRSPEMMFLCIVALVLGFSYCGVYHVYLHWMPILFLSIILFGAGYIQFPKWLNNKFVLYLSAISYAFFLGQKFVWFPTQIILRHINIHIGNIPFIVFMLLACVLSAIILHELVEKKTGVYLKKKMLTPASAGANKQIIN